MMTFNREDGADGADGEASSSADGGWPGWPGVLDPIRAQAQSIYKVTRALKKEQNSLYNCINSIVHDASFVDEVRALYPGLPLLANLRCGLWYTSLRHDGTCYYKSTDGHNGNWSFSTTRLNWHVADAAARQGGVLVVDATRKGKSFPVSRWGVDGRGAMRHARVARQASKASTLPSRAQHIYSPCMECKISADGSVNCVDAQCLPCMPRMP